MADIVSIGECFVEFFSYDRLHADADLHMTYSGDTYNVLSMATRLGSSCGYVSKVSDDPLGDYLLQSWSNDGIDTTHVTQTRGFNAFEFSSSQPPGEGTKVLYRKGAVASTMSIADLERDYITAAKVLHVSGITQGISDSCRELVMEAVKIAHDSGVTISYDTNLRLNMWSVEEARCAMYEVLPYIDIITPSFPHEPRALIGRDTEREVIDHFLDQGVNTVALKCGDEGAWVGTRDRMAQVAAVAPDGILHTSGAGDTFVGGLLHCISEGMDPFEGTKWGVACAGLKVGGPSIEAQPRRADVEKLLPLVQLQEV